MNLLGNNLLGSLEAEVPYQDKYIPPYEYTPAVDRPAYREAGIFPLKRPPTAPLLPYPIPRRQIPPASGAQYIQGPIGDIVPAREQPYPKSGIISDREIIKILTSKNLFNALARRGMATLAGRRQIIDANIRRAIENEVIAQTRHDLDLVSQGRYQEIQVTEDWQREALRANLLNAASLHNLLRQVVGLQVWHSKEKGA